MEKDNSDKSDRYYRYARNEMLDFVPKEISTVLEIGCAEGLFGQMLKAERLVQVWGVELFPEAARVAAERIDKVIVGDIERDDIQLPDGFFDCIVFNDVLEHLQNPWTVLENIRKKLKSEGCIVASIPNIRFYPVIKKLLLEKDWKYENEGVMDITHYRFFTEKSIKRMFESNGYTLRHIAGIHREELPWKFGVLNKLLFNSLYDMQFMQFACVAMK